MSAVEWHAKWFEVGRYQEWLPVRAADSYLDALDGVTSAPGYKQDRMMLDELLAMTRVEEYDEVALQVLQADDDVWVYVRGDQVVVAKEHEYETVDKHRYSLLTRAEFLRFLEFLDQVATNGPATTHCQRCDNVELVTTGRGVSIAHTNSNPAPAGYRGRRKM